MNNNSEKKQLKKPVLPWEKEISKTVAFIVTENCQLRCKYCYQPKKNKTNKMSFDIAKKSVDYFLNNKTYCNEKSVLFDFFGGEPLLEIELIDQISEYIKKSMKEINHKWLNNYTFTMTTNGILYNSKKVQEYIKKNHDHIRIKMSLDGTREKHNLNRIYPDGTGSYDDVVKNIPLWLEQFENPLIKATVGSDDLPYVKESVLHLWKLGIKVVLMNCVTDNVWKDGDDKIYEEQLKALADYIIENEMYTDYSCSFFGNHIGKPIQKSENKNWCGCGKYIIAVDHKGDFYPCHRFLTFSLANKKGKSIGNCFDGIELNKLRPYQALDRITQSTDECVDCETASGCEICAGNNYDNACTDTMYQRSTYICKMHKARVRANTYYYNRLVNEKGIKIDSNKTFQN